jgi:hypothetical protein
VRLGFHPRVSIRLEMLQVARLAPKALGPEATQLVAEFLRRQQCADGGFSDRKGQSDLYYTVFAVDALTALQQPLDSPALRDFLQRFADGTNLDFVHTCALARCWNALGESVPESLRQSLLQRLEQHRAADGGFHPTIGSPRGTAYGAFLALAAYQDLKAELPQPLELVRSLKFLETEDGAWTNEVFGRRRMPVGATNATAAAVTVLRHLGMPINPAVGKWLLAQAHPQGGFLAVPGAPLPDLLSTATALHALSGLQESFDAVREACLDYVDSLWTNEGSFHGNWADEHLDCEYTCYGLLALGHLSV